MGEGAGQMAERLFDGGDCGWGASVFDHMGVLHRMTEIIFLRMALKGRVARVVGRVPSGRS